ncbi:MAG: ribonuclease HI family protein [Vulcanimicrobiaceae bacterium]
MARPSPQAVAGARRATLFADGGSRGNPGPAAGAAVLVSPEGKVLAEVGTFLGTATNNVAEWRGLLGGLVEAERLGIEQLTIRLDSELVVRQLQGIYRVKHPDLIPLAAEARRRLARFASYEVAHVPRAANALADALVNRTLDAALAGGARGAPERR